MGTKQSHKVTAFNFQYVSWLLGWHILMLKLSMSDIELFNGDNLPLKDIVMEYSFNLLSYLINEDFDMTS